MNIFKTIGSGYLRSINTLGSNILTGVKIVAFLLFVLLLSVGIVYPLWMIADSSPQLYSQIVIYTVIASLVLYILYKTIKNIVTMGPKSYFLYKFFPFFGKLFIVIFLVALILITVYLFNIAIIYGILSLLLFLFIFGLLRFVKKK